MRALRCTPLLTLLSAAALAVATPAGATAAGSQGAECQVVHVGPQIAAGAQRRNYFQVSLRPGASARLALIAANPGSGACAVQVLPAYGTTAVNSGDSYSLAPAGTCRGTSCWLSGLPVTVEVRAGRRVVIPFRVAVPAGTGGGEYLAGVVAGPAVAPAAPKVRRGTVGAIVVARVAVGVAITVPGPLRPGLEIPAVRLDPHHAGVLAITEHDGGNTWEHPHGLVRIAVGRRRMTFAVGSATVLPGDSATLAVPIGALPAGRWATEVQLRYDHGRRTATWRGVIGFQPLVRGAGGALEPATVLPTRMPGWVLPVLIVLLICTATLAISVTALLRVRRRRGR